MVPFTYSSTKPPVDGSLRSTVGEEVQTVPHSPRNEDHGVVGRHPVGTRSRTTDPLREG